MHRDEPSMTDRHDHIRAIFAEASALSADQRGAFLDAKCQGNVGLRAEVDSLLAHADQAGSDFLSPMAPPDESPRDGDDADVGEKLLKRVASTIQGELHYRFIKDHRTLVSHFTSLASKTTTAP